MAYGIRLRVWGKMAGFIRPEMKVERVSYDVMTPSAARGVLEAIYWKPQMKWLVDRIRVLQPIRFTSIRRNEIASKISVKGARGVAAAMKDGKVNLGLEVDQDRQQRAATVLRDVSYGIEAHVETTDPDKCADAGEIAKHLEMFKRRAARGQYFHHPYLGCREFPADFELVDEFEEAPQELRGEVQLGYMLHDIDFVPDAKGPVVESSRGIRLRPSPRFFRAVMLDGVIEVPPFSESRA